MYRCVCVCVCGKGDDENDDEDVQVEKNYFPLATCISEEETLFSFQF